MSASSLASLHRKALRKLFVGGAVAPSAGPTPRSDRVEGPSAGARRHPPDQRSSTFATESSSANAARKDDNDVVASLQTELDNLRKRRAFLVGEIERARHGAISTSEHGKFDEVKGAPTWTTVANELDYVRTRANGHGDDDASSSSSSGGKAHRLANRPYLHIYDDRDGVGLVRKKRKKDPSGRLKGCTPDPNCAPIAMSSSNLHGSGKVPSALGNNHASHTNHDGDGARTVHDIAATMHAIRKKRCIAAAHRLAGISALPFLGGEIDDDNVLGVRIDVCLRGEFVGRYHIFFDVVTIRRPHKVGERNDENEGEENSSSNVMRLAQHTLPTPGVSVQPIIERSFGHGGMLFLDDDDISSSAIHAMGRIQQCVGEMYDACYAYEMRRDACQYLRRMETKNQDEGTRWTEKSAPVDGNGADGHGIKNVAHNDAFDRISFEMSITAGRAKASCFSIQLCYDNQLVARPTAMRVVVVKETSCADEEQDHQDENGDSDQSSNNDGGLVQEIRGLLNTCHIPDAMRELLD